VGENRGPSRRSPCRSSRRMRKHKATGADALHGVAGGMFAARGVRRGFGGARAARPARAFRSWRRWARGDAACAIALLGDGPGGDGGLDEKPKHRKSPEPADDANLWRSIRRVGLSALLGSKIASFTNPRKLDTKTDHPPLGGFDQRLATKLKDFGAHRR